LTKNAKALFQSEWLKIQHGRKGRWVGKKKRKVHTAMSTIQFVEEGEERKSWYLKDAAKSQPAWDESDSKEASKKRRQK